MGKLRVLITGMSRMQAGVPTKLGVVQFGALMAEALRDAGHHVEHRPAVVGERLGGVFDVVLVGISPTGMVGTQVFCAWDVIGRARAAGCGLGFWLDDHKLTQLRDTIKSDIGTPTERPIMVEGKPSFAEGARLLKDDFRSRPGRDWALAHLSDLVGVGKALMERPWPTTIIPAHRWGDHDMMIKKALRVDVPRPVFVDPSGYAPQHCNLGLPWDERKRAWVSAALPDKKLSDWPVSRWRVEWDVVEYGDAKVPGQTRITEAEVFESYQRAVGVLAMRRTKHDGSGWWRVRYAHAARAKSVVLASSADATAMGGAFTVPVETMEAMTSTELRDLAHAQSEEYARREWSRETFRDYMDQLVNYIAVHEQGPVVAR